MSAKGLTDAEQKFCLLVVKGQTQAAAFRTAFPKSSSWKDATVHSKASTLAASEKVRGRIEELRAQAAERTGLTLDAHLRELESLRNEARDAGAFAPAVTAEVSRGKAAGLYEQRATVTVKGLDWKALLSGNAPGGDEPDDEPAT